MSDLGGYRGRSLEFLNAHGVIVGDSVRVTSELAYDGILMPKYEGGGEVLVLKLKSGYNVGIELDGVTGIVKLPRGEESPAVQEAAPGAKGAPKILLLSTGGTIASKIDYRTGAVSPALTPEELHASVPELSDIADVVPKTLFSEYSENLQPEHWVEIARELDGAAGSGYSGIIIAHGTDTMQYTAAYLAFALEGFPVPVALVGAQRSSDRPSSDAATNLVAAARFLTQEGKKGIYVVMHHGEDDETISCHLATRVRKNHTSRRGAFATVGADPAFLIVNGKVEGRTDGDFFAQSDYKPRIAMDAAAVLLKYHPGMDPGMLEHAVKSGCRAVILEGTGLGHVGRIMYDVIRNALESGVFIGMTSQCIDGRVRMTVYDNGRDLLGMGVVPLKDMIPETALVKAMWALGIAKDSGQIEELMLRNIASEISD